MIESLEYFFLKALHCTYEKYCSMFEGFARLHDMCISVNNQLYVMDCVDEVYFFVSEYRQNHL